MTFSVKKKKMLFVNEEFDLFNPVEIFIMLVDQ